MSRISIGLIQGDDRFEEIGRNLPATVPDLKHGFTVAQMAGEQLQFTIRFNAVWESGVQIYDQDTGALLAGTNNYDNHTPVYVPPAVAGGTKVFAVFGFHKRSRPNAGEAWRYSAVRILDDSQSLKVVGFDDSGDDGDFNDATVEIQFRAI